MIGIGLLSFTFFNFINFRRAIGSSQCCILYSSNACKMSMAVFTFQPWLASIRSGISLPMAKRMLLMRSTSFSLDCPSFTLIAVNPASLYFNASAAIFSGSPMLTVISVNNGLSIFPPVNSYNGKPACCEAISCKAISKALFILLLPKMVLSIFFIHPFRSRGSWPFNDLARY